MENEVANDKEKALKELESLRGKVSNVELDWIIEEVNDNFDKGFGSPAVLVHINDYAYGSVVWVITVILSFQGSASVTRFVKNTYSTEASTTKTHFTPEMVRWMAAADKGYQERNLV